MFERGHFFFHPAMLGDTTSLHVLASSYHGGSFMLQGGFENYKVVLKDPQQWGIYWVGGEIFLEELGCQCRGTDHRVSHA